MATKVLASSGEKVDADRIVGRLAMVNLPIIPLSQSEYDALTTEEQNNGCIYAIYDDPEEA